MMLRFLLGTLLAAHAVAKVEHPCSPCADGAALNSSLTLSDGTNCTAISLQTNDLTSASAECHSLQVTAFEHCGCPTAPPATSSRAQRSTCSICPDGSPVDEDVIIPMAGGVTCGSAQDLASQANATTCIDFSNYYAAWCGCPNVEPMCSLCPDGALPPDLSLEIEGLDATCGQVAFAATTLSDETQCEEISTMASVCGCPSGQDSACTVCPNGQPVQYPDLELENGATCTDVEIIANSTHSARDCKVLQNYAAYDCGCNDSQDSAPPLTCTSLCPDGSPAPLSDRVVDVLEGQQVTCGSLNNEVELGFANANRCKMYFYIGVNVCGCKNDRTDDPAPCDLCEDGSVPRHLFQAVDGRSTCADFAAEAREIHDARRCTALQATAGVTCGCDNPISAKQACHFCAEDQFLPDPSRIADATSGISCAEAEYVGTIAPEDTVCPALKRNYGEACCADKHATRSPEASTVEASTAHTSKLAFLSMLLFLFCGVTPFY